MLAVETIAWIRRNIHAKKKPIKAIARELEISRNTVRKALRSEEAAFTYDQSSQPMPKLAPLEEWIINVPVRSVKCVGEAGPPLFVDLTIPPALESIPCRRGTQAHFEVQEGLVPSEISYRISGLISISRRFAWKQARHSSSQAVRSSRKCRFPKGPPPVPRMVFSARLSIFSNLKKLSHCAG